MPNDYALNGSLIHLLHRASQVANDKFSSHAELGDLTARQFVVLAAVADSDGGSQTTLVERTGVDRSTLADVIRRLQSKGLVSRKRMKQDARAYSVRLTEAGRRMLDAARPIARRVDTQILGAIAAPKRADLAESLRLIADHVPLSSRGTTAR